MYHPITLFSLIPKILNFLGLVTRNPEFIPIFTHEKKNTGTMISPKHGCFRSIMAGSYAGSVSALNKFLSTI